MFPFTAVFANVPLSHTDLDTIPVDSSLKFSRVVKTWDLPEPLKRVSGFDFIDDDRIACIQDVAGIIYIYNIRSRRLERQIEFAPPGNYHSICIVGSTAYIACADGRLLEISNFLSRRRVVREHGTHLSIRQDVEGVCYDKPNKRLLVAIRGADESGQNYKAIYQFDLPSRSMSVTPAVKIDLTDTLLNPAQSRKIHLLLQPSDIAIHPATQQLYICDATKSQVVVLDAAGTVKEVRSFPPGEIIQPEGIRITPSGELYIVSAAFKDGFARLMLISIS